MKRLILLALFVMLAIPASNVFASTRNYLRESGAQLPNYRYSLMFNATLSDLTSGTVQYNNMWVVYNRQNSDMDSHTGQVLPGPWIVFRFYGIPSCNQVLAPNYTS